MEKGNDIYPPHLSQKFNTRLSEETFANMFSIEVTNDDEITADTIKYYKKKDENYKIGDKKTGYKGNYKLKPINNKDELETLYQKRLESYLKVIENSTKTDFIKDELEQLNSLLSYVDRGTLQKSNHYGIMKRYEEILNQGLSTDVAQISITENLMRFKNTGEKYVLLKELGIIDFLNDKYPLPSNAKMSLLLAYITDTKSSKTFENILSQINNSKSEHYPFKESNETTITHIFSHIGILKQTKIAAIKKDKKK